jgi:multidrug efflux pump subunit AcrA (membrane-fusion protein)
MTENISQNQPLKNTQSSSSQSQVKVNNDLPGKTPAILRILPLILLTFAFGRWGVTARIPVKVVGSSILIVPRSSVDFQTRSSGRVKELKVAVGDKVKKGQVLAILESNQLKEEILNKGQELAEYQAENIAITGIERQRSQLKIESIIRQEQTIPFSIRANNQQIESNRQEQRAIARQRKTYTERLSQIDEIDQLISQRFEAYNKLVE